MPSEMWRCLRCLERFERQPKCPHCGKSDELDSVPDDQHPKPEPDTPF